MSRKPQLAKPLSKSDKIRVKLKPLNGSSSREISIGDFATLGNAPNSQVPLFGERVSSRHARIEKKEQDYIIKDLNSSVGTYVNGVRIIEAVLQNHDVIAIDHQLFQFKDPTIKTEGAEVFSNNASWRRELQSLPFLAKSEFPVLITGESGTGKEVMARKIHDLSNFSLSKYVAINCSAFTESLIESELFGHIRGSFTGATSDRKGAFEAARNGTLFLDEIGDLPLNLQPKLLRALENKEIRPVGSDRCVETRVRIIAATHKDLRERVQRGEFRADLYFRLNAISLEIPPLKKRLEDFEPLLYSFARHCKVGFSFAAVKMLREHSWPGNIRELKNVVARASVLFPGIQVGSEHIHRLLDEPFYSSIPSSLQTPQKSNYTPPMTVKDVEKKLIVERLAANSGNQRKTAVDLGLPKSTLHDRIRHYKINPKKFFG